MSPLRDAITEPNLDATDQGAKYCIALDVENRCRTGKIWNEHGDVEWHYGPRRNPLGYSLRNPLNKPDYVFFDFNEQEMVTIRRVSFVPSRFQVLVRGHVAGHITMQSPLLNHYKIVIDGFATCVFRMPLFTVYFHGHVKNVAGVWVVVGPSKTQWNILVRSDLDDIRLLSSIALIHYQWFNYN